MTALLRWACLALAVACANAIVCTPGICAKTECDACVTRERCCGPMQQFQPKGGLCGCCPLCVTFIPEGGACFPERGVPSSRQCISGTACTNGICQAVQCGD